MRPFQEFPINPRYICLHMEIVKNETIAGPPNFPRRWQVSFDRSRWYSHRNLIFIHTMHIIIFNLFNKNLLLHFTICTQYNGSGAICIYLYIYMRRCAREGRAKRAFYLCCWCFLYARAKEWQKVIPALFYTRGHWKKTNYTINANKNFGFENVMRSFKSLIFLFLLGKNVCV